MASLIINIDPESVLELLSSCALRVVLAVVKWCSRRDSCTASEIAATINRPTTLFTAPHARQMDNPEALCWTDTGNPNAEELRLPAVRTVYVELASRALAFLTPSPKGEEHKRVQAVLRWIFDVARTMDVAGADSVLQKLEEIVELFQQQDYLRALSQTVTMAIAKIGCTDNNCDAPKTLEKALRLFSAVASYLRVYDDTKALDPAEAKAARKKAIESLIDSATDRRQRAGDWIVSLGVPVGVSSGRRWTPGTSSQGYKSSALRDAYEKEFVPFTWRLPLGLAAQALRDKEDAILVGYHMGLTFADLGNFVRGGAQGKVDEVQWKDFLQIGGQLGLLFGNRRHSILLAADVTWSPGLYQRDVLINTPAGPETKTLSGALQYGVTVAYYVPIFDLN